MWDSTRNAMALLGVLMIGLYVWLSHLYSQAAVHIHEQTAMIQQLITRLDTCEGKVIDLTIALEQEQRKTKPLLPPLPGTDTLGGTDNVLRR